MKEQAEFMARQPGLVSISLHRGEDDSHVVNYVQWTDKDKLAAAHHSPEFRRSGRGSASWCRMSSRSTTWCRSKRLRIWLRLATACRSIRQRVDEQRVGAALQAKMKRVLSRPLPAS